MLIDIGVNFSNSRFDKTAAEVLERARDAGVEKLILTGTSVTESEAVVNSAASLASAFPTCSMPQSGIHPHDAKALNKESIGTLKALADDSPQWSPSVKWGWILTAIFRPQRSRKKPLRPSLNWRRNYKLPVFLHERDAADRQLQILRTTEIILWMP